MLGRFSKGRVLAVALLWAHAGCADERFSFSDQSSEDKLRTQAGLHLGGGTASVDANVTLEGANGKTRVMPKLTSRFESGDRLDVTSVLSLGDWNSSKPSEPSVATKIVLRSGLPVLERLEGDFRQLAAGSKQSLRLGFADVGLDGLGGAPIKLKTALTLRSGDSANAFSNLSSSISLGRALAMNTEWQFADDGYDTKFSYQARTAFVEQIVANLKRTPGGNFSQSIGVRFPSISRAREIGPALKVTSGATLEETCGTNGIETLLMTLQANIAGIRAGFLGGTSKLSVNLAQALDEVSAERASLAYDHAWAPSDETSIALNLKMLHKTGDVEPTLGLKWSSRF